MSVKLEDVKYPPVMQELFEFSEGPFGLTLDSAGSEVVNLVGRAGGTIQALSEAIANRDAKIKELEGALKPLEILDAVRKGKL